MYMGVYAVVKVVILYLSQIIRYRMEFELSEDDRTYKICDECEDACDKAITIYFWIAILYTVYEVVLFILLVMNNAEITKMLQ